MIHQNQNLIKINYPPQKKICAPPPPSGCFGSYNIIIGQVNLWLDSASISNCHSSNNNNNIIYIYIYIYTVDLSDSLVVAGILNQFKVNVKCQHQLGLARLVFLILTLRHSEVSCSLFLVLSLSG